MGDVGDPPLEGMTIAITAERSAGQQADLFHVSPALRLRGLHPSLSSMETPGLGLRTVSLIPCRIGG
jgi:hypothetical protein